MAGRFLQEDDGGLSVSPTVAPTRPDISSTLAGGDLVAVLNVTDDYGTATATALPGPASLSAVAPTTTIDGVSAENRCAAAAAIDDPAEIDQVSVLQVGFWTVDDPDPCGCDSYNVNCRNFGETDRERYPFDRDLPIGEIEHWRVGASVDGHPFHIHINPFLTCPDDSVFDPVPFPHWRDTVLVNLDRKLDLVTEYRQYEGAFVFHCHKLTHEDEGMMQVVRTCDPATDATCGDNHWSICDEDDLACIQQLAATECAITVRSDIEAAACVAMLGGPGGVCGPHACVPGDDCGPGRACLDNVCQPAPTP